jgi:hypothetical protein
VVLFCNAHGIGFGPQRPNTCHPKHVRQVEQLVPQARLPSVGRDPQGGPTPFLSRVHLSMLHREPPVHVKETQKPFGAARVSPHKPARKWLAIKGFSQKPHQNRPIRFGRLAYLDIVHTVV